MKIMLDTHVLLWWLNDSNLSKETKLIIENPKNIIFVSAVSTWEIMIKKMLGKLQVPDDLERAIESNHFFPLSLTLSHTMGILSLPCHHHDPFDRMLISQSMIENCILMTKDERMGKYEIPIIWA